MSTDTVIVFGASRGLGEAIAWRLVEAGRAVAVVCRKASDAQGVADRIEAAGGRALALAADVTDFDAVKAGVEQASAWRGGIAAIVNNAGTIEPIALLGDTDPGAWARLISVNLVGAYHCIRASLPHLSANGVVVKMVEPDRPIQTDARVMRPSAGGPWPAPGWRRRARGDG